MGHEDSGLSRGGVVRVVVIDDDEILLHGIAAWLSHAAPRPDGTTDGLDVRVVGTAKSVTELLARVAQPNGMRTNGTGGYSRTPYETLRRNNGVHPGEPARGTASVPSMRPRTFADDGPITPLAPVALLDLRLRDGRRVAENVMALIQAGFAVVTCSTIDDAGLVHEAGRAGALSYVRKSQDATDMRQALAAAANGERHVSQSHAALIQRTKTYGVPELSGQEREALRLYASGLTMSSVARRLNVKQGTAKSYLDRVRDKYEQAGRAARTKLELRDRAVEDGVLSSPRLE
ncbi:LuxR C-terminal-related transcriptional regulator [Cryptosporangium phraense]|uniref:Response regulator transcription factor n=1 Tax=Cryptosporangium phraense TaxID=2593070 RepID=A0A545APM0_9ACTN|nr:LuxR C-terminal-related transcriptional regulator [Cryptosporangium phraense]TQS43272.1 response regulator transcription factor [Cryptosporangium phraense]